MSAGGRVLLQNLDGSVRHTQPFVVACECQGHALDLAIRRVSTFAFALTGIIAAIVAVGAAPLLIGTIALLWAAAATAARLFASRRRRQHGRFIVDFERDVLTAFLADGSEREAPLANDAAVRVEESMDAQAPYWLLLAISDGSSFRLARGRSEELSSILQLFRSYNYTVDRLVLDRAESE